MSVFTKKPNEKLQQNKSQSKNALELLPHLLTLSSVLLGFLSIRYSIIAFANPLQIEELSYKAAFLIFLATFLDAADGRVARMMNLSSAFGIQIDSLADLVSFCVAPTILIYVVHLHQVQRLGFSISFLFLACGIIRLARFNVLSLKTNQKSFLGLPSPAAGMGLVMINLVRAEFNRNSEDFTNISPFWKILNYVFKQIDHPIVFLFITFFLALAMVSNFEYFGVKELKLPQKRPFSSLILIVIGLSALFSLGFFFALFVLLFLYILHAPILYAFQKNTTPTEEESFFDSHEKPSSSNEDPLN
jgi:CDP-diacylglycerol--serine O-phosphatidyltransferase